VSVVRCAPCRPSDSWPAPFLSPPVSFFTLDE
jgi:hypothetical protein